MSLNVCFFEVRFFVSTKYFLLQFVEDFIFNEKDDFRINDFSPIREKTDI